MYAIVKLEHEARICDGFCFEANFKRHMKIVVQINQSSKEVKCSFRQLAME